MSVPARPDQLYLAERTTSATSCTDTIWLHLPLLFPSYLTTRGYHQPTMPAVKHEMSSENECPATPSLPKKPRSTSRSSEADVKPSTPRKNAKVKSERGAFTPTKKMGSWSREELKLLYTIMCSKLVSGLRYGWVRWEVGGWLTIDWGQMG